MFGQIVYESYCAFEKNKKSQHITWSKLDRKKKNLCEEIGKAVYKDVADIESFTSKIFNVSCACNNCNFNSGYVSYEKLFFMLYLKNRILEKNSNGEYTCQCHKCDGILTVRPYDEEMTVDNLIDITVLLKFE